MTPQIVFSHRQTHHIEMRVLTKATQGRIDTVGSVCGSHDNDMGSLLQTIHQCQQLGHNTTLHFSVGLARKEHNYVKESTIVELSLNSVCLAFLLVCFLVMVIINSSKKFLLLNLHLQTLITNRCSTESLANYVNGEWI